MSLVNIYDNYIITFDGTKDINRLTDKEKINFIDRLPITEKNKLGLDFNTGVSLDKVRDIDVLMEKGDYYMHLLDNYVLYPLQYESQSLSKNMQKVNNMQARFVEQEIKQKVLTIIK